MSRSEDLILEKVIIHLLNYSSILVQGATPAFAAPGKCDFKSKQFLEFIMAVGGDSGGGLFG